MNYILTMSLSGSCMFLMYKICRSCLANRVSEKWYYVVMKAVMLYFLVPLPLLKLGYKKAWWFIRGEYPGAHTTIYYQDEMVVFSNGEQVVFNDTALVQGAIVGLWVIGTLVIGILFIMAYLRRRKALITHCAVVHSELEQEIQTQLLEKCAVHKDVEFRHSEIIKSPFTIGFFKPIIFYNASVENAEKELLLTHEWTHVKRRDMFWQWGAMLVVIMHWYNPLAWLFKREFERACEYSCDEQVLQKESEEIRFKYAEILIKYGTKKKGESLEANLSKGGKETAIRMKKILEKTEKLPTIATAFIMGLLIVLNSLTVFAYEDVKIAKGEGYMEESFYENDFAFTPKGEELVWEDADYITEYEYHYDVQFVDEDGNVYEVHEDVEMCATCEHEYVEGIVSRHIKNSSGGCTIEFYNAMRCQKCERVINLVYLSSTNYAVCPH